MSDVLLHVVVLTLIIAAVAVLIQRYAVKASSAITGAEGDIKTGVAQAAAKAETVKAQAEAVAQDIKKV